MKSAVLFDLDDTLVIDDLATDAAFHATATRAAKHCGVEPRRLASAAAARADELWRGAPADGYCARVGISAPEGLWCRFAGVGPEVRALRGWAPGFRRETWRLGLADVGVADVDLADELAERYCTERRARQEAFADVVETLSELRKSHALGLVTNGAACLQREKLAAAGLENEFEAVVVSADLGVGKPDPIVFERALKALNVSPDRAAMVGDSVVHDMDGARAACIPTVWINRGGHATRPERAEPREISTLRDLPAVLSELLSGYSSNAFA